MGRLSPFTVQVNLKIFKVDHASNTNCVKIFGKQMLYASRSQTSKYHDNERQSD